MRPTREVVTIRDPAPMIELFGLLLAALIDALRSRERLLLENLLLRQQLQVALRSRRRPDVRVFSSLRYRCPHLTVRKVLRRHGLPPAFQRGQRSCASSSASTPTRSLPPTSSPRHCRVGSTWF